jgi:hypothetical protein
VYFVLNYSARNQRRTAWKHMSFCFGIIDMKPGKYLLDHPIMSARTSMTGIRSLGFSLAMTQTGNLEPGL